jgi:nucleoside-diphosphate-sugar epimerase
VHALITGGAGSIGSRLAAALIERGDSVTVVDVRPDPVAPSAAFERADVRVGETQAPGFIEGIVAETRPDAIFHLASILSGRSETDSDLAWRVNLDGIRYVLEAARIHNVGRVLFPSSVATFGMGVGETVTDDSPQWPAGLYGVTKVLGERLGVYYHQRFGVDFRCVRLSAMVAPTAPAAGAASAFVCELYMGAVREGGYTFKVYPHSRIPLVWVEDVVGALLQLHDVPASQLTRRVYQVMGSNPTVRDMAEAVQRRMPQVRLAFDPDPVRADIVDSWASSMDDASARADWGWSPRFNLEGMTDAVLEELQTEQPVG